MSSCKKSGNGYSPVTVSTIYETVLATLYAVPLFRWQAFVYIHETVCIPVSPRRVIPTRAIFWHTLPLGMHEEVFAMVCNKNVHFIDDKKHTCAYSVEQP